MFNKSTKKALSHLAPPAYFPIKIERTDASMKRQNQQINSFWTATKGYIVDSFNKEKNAQKR